MMKWESPNYVLKQLPSVLFGTWGELGILLPLQPPTITSPFTDILVNVDSTCITRCPIFLISHQIHGTPNTRFFIFFQNWEGKKRVIGVEQYVPIKLCVIGVSGNSKSCSGLGYTETCDTIRCHLKNFWCFLLELFPSFFSIGQWEA